MSSVDPYFLNCVWSLFQRENDGKFQQQWKSTVQCASRWDLTNLDLHDAYGGSMLCSKNHWQDQLAGKNITHSMPALWGLSQPIQGFESVILYCFHNLLMCKLHFDWGVVLAAWGICVQSQADTLDKAKVKQTSDWQCDMFCEHWPTANYTSQDNCSVYSPTFCCCFLPV